MCCPVTRITAHHPARGCSGTVAEGSTENHYSEKQVVCMVLQRNLFFPLRGTQEVNLSRPGSSRGARLPQPFYLAPLSGPAPPECFGKPPHCRISVGQTHYTHSRAKSTQFLAWPFHASVPLAQVDKTRTSILSGYGGSSQGHPWKITRAQQFIVYETLSLSASSNETHNILVGRDSPILQIERLRLRVRKIK